MCVIHERLRALNTSTSELAYMPPANSDEVHVVAI